MRTMISTGLTAGLVAVAVTTAGADDVHPDVIFGSGNANGSFTISTGGGVELGLRAKVRYNASGFPENTFNYDGVNTYTFNPNDGNTPGNRAMWNFEWSINSDVEGTTGNNLTAFTYQMALFKIGADGTNIADAVAFDPINTPYADHSIGDNSTGNGAGTEAADATEYANLIANNNVAQNSWNYDFFDGGAGTALENWDPDELGTYLVRLTAYDNLGDAVSSDSIYINVVPLPTAAFAGLGLLGAFAGIRAVRRR